jgi:hypothetical protein
MGLYMPYMWGMISTMKATLIYRKQFYHGQGRIEAIAWAVPSPLRPSVHGFKYRLVYIVDGEGVVGYDNEFGKGDHRHLGEIETPYVWVDRNTLMDDFMNDVRER